MGMVAISIRRRLRCTPSANSCLLLPNTIWIDEQAVFVYLSQLCQGMHLYAAAIESNVLASVRFLNNHVARDQG